MTGTNLIPLTLLNIFGCDNLNSGIFWLIGDFLIADRFSMHLWFHLFAFVDEFDLFGEGLNSIFVGFNLIVRDVVMIVVDLFSQEVIDAEI